MLGALYPAQAIILNILASISTTVISLNFDTFVSIYFVFNQVYTKLL